MGAKRITNDASGAIEARTANGTPDLGRGRRPSQAGFHDDQQVKLPIVLTVEKAADRLGVGRTVMYALISSGAVESVRIGRLRRVPADALVAFLDALRDCQRGGAA